MNTTEDIRILIDRFFNGDTTLKEEQRLYEYFRGPVPADLEELRPVFQGFGRLQQPEVRPQSAPHTSRKAWAIAAAAAAVIVFGAGILIKETHRQPPTPLPRTALCEAYVYGRHITDSTEVMNQVAVTLQTLTSAPAVDVDNQLKTIFAE